MEYRLEAYKDYYDNKKEIVDLRAQLLNCNNSLTEANKTIEALKSDDTKNLLIATQAQLKGQTERIKNCTRELEVKTAELDASNKTIRDLRAQISELEKAEKVPEDYHINKNLLEATKAQLKGVTARLNKANADIEARDRQIEELNKQLMEVLRSKDNLDSTLNTTKETLKSKEAEIIRLKGDKTNLETQLSTKNNDLTARTNELNKCKQDLTKANQDLNRANAVANANRNELNTLKPQIAEKDSLIATLRQEKQAAEDNVRVANQSVVTYKNATKDLLNDLNTVELIVLIDKLFKKLMDLTVKCEDFLKYKALDNSWWASNVYT